MISSPDAVRALAVGVREFPRTAGEWSRTDNKDFLLMHDGQSVASGTIEEDDRDDSPTGRFAGIRVSSQPVREFPRTAGEWSRSGNEALVVMLDDHSVASGTIKEDDRDDSLTGRFAGIRVSIQHPAAQQHGSTAAVS